MPKPIKVDLAASEGEKQVLEKHGQLAKNLCQKASVPTWSVTDRTAVVEVTWVTERGKDRKPTATQPGGTLKQGEETKCVCGVEDVILHLKSTGKSDTAKVEIDVCIDWECEGKGKEFELCTKKEKERKRGS